ncbi:MAG TPA: shikimate kinase [Candidatus Binatia bacterium]|jgi:shikimate kinase
MAVGKTIVGRKLARRLRWRFVDLDRAIERAEGMKVQAIFERKGETAFRELERRKLGDVLGQERQVIATGGGAVVDEENLRLLREKSFLICLKAQPETLLKRAGGGKRRPLLDVADRQARIAELLRSREKNYAEAHASIETDGASVDDVVEKIIALVQPWV